MFCKVLKGILLLIVLVSTSIAMPSFSSEAEKFNLFLSNDLVALSEARTCLSAKYLSALTGDNSDHNCIPRESSGLQIYYDMQSELISSYWSLEFKKANQIVLSALKKKALIDYIDNDIYVTHLRNDAKRYLQIHLALKTTLRVQANHNKGAFISVLEDEAYQVDTGVRFAVTNASKCEKNDILSKNIIGALGKKTKMSQCLIIVQNDKIPALISDITLPLIGMRYLLSYDKIINAEKEQKIQKQYGKRIYYDGYWLFFRSSIKFSASEFHDVNICLDTGAKNSYLSPKIYSKSKHLLQNKEVVIVSADSQMGSQSNLGKIIDEIEINLNSRTITLSDIPIFVRHNSLEQCDLIAGFDILQNFVSLDISNRSIYF